MLCSMRGALNGYTHCAVVFPAKGNQLKAAINEHEPLLAIKLRFDISMVLDDSLCSLINLYYL